MKIALNMNQEADSSGRAEQDRALERDILAVKAGDWSAKDRLSKVFSPLIHKLAKKRSDNETDVSRYIEAGQNGVAKAAKRYKRAHGPHEFRIGVIEYIEKAMDSAAKGSFFSRLFGS
jgi:hypothetical protein